MLATNPTSGDFVEHFFKQIAYQPDDKIAKHALETILDPDFTATINESTVSRDRFIALFLVARSKELFELVQSRELIASPPNQDGEVAAVSHLQTFRTTPTTSDGKAPHKVQSLTICLLRSSQGEKKLLQLTEITKPLA